MSEGLMFILSGIMFLLLIFWQTRKDRLYLFELEKKLEEKEKRLYELYQALEDVLSSVYVEVANTMPDNNSLKPKVEPQIPIEKVYNDKHKAVILMHKNGSTDEEIAKKLGIGKGEVKLILDLKDN